MGGSFAKKIIMNHIRHHMKRTATLVGLCLTMLSTYAQKELSTKSVVPDKILVNGKVYTVNSDHPYAEVIAIKGNKIEETKSVMTIVDGKIVFDTKKLKIKN